MTLLGTLLVLPQKIFVMPNMDDVWLPIMHSAMDTRSNANLVTVTNDALKDPEPEESEVSSDMWRFGVVSVRWWTFYRHGNMTRTRPPLPLHPGPTQKPRVRQWARPTLRYFYPHPQSRCRTRLWPFIEVHSRNWKHWRARDHLWPLKAGEGKRIVTCRFAVLFVWHQILWLILWWNTIHRAWWDWWWIDWQIAIWFNPKNHITCDVQLHQTW